MDFVQLCLKRESSRDLTGEKIPREVLQQIVECGRLAPSACNSQPWHFYVVDKSEQLDALKQAVQWFKTNKFTDNASAFIILTGTKASYPERVGEAICGRDFSTMDIGMAVENMALCAASLGYGSCILGGFYEKKVKEAVRLPKSSKESVRLVLALGKPKSDIAREKKRKEMAEVVTFVE